MYEKFLNKVVLVVYREEQGTQRTIFILKEEDRDFISFETPTKHKQYVINKSNVEKIELLPSEQINVDLL